MYTHCYNAVVVVLCIAMTSQLSKVPRLHARLRALVFIREFSLRVAELSMVCDGVLCVLFLSPGYLCCLVAEG